MTQRPSLALGLAAIAAGACTQLLGATPATLLEEPVVDASSPDAEDAPTLIECDADLATSSDHCGTCGRSCLGASCVGGRCEAIRIADVAALPYAIMADEGDVVWITRVGARYGESLDLQIFALAREAERPTKVVGVRLPRYSPYGFWRPSAVLAERQVVVFTGPREILTRQVMDLVRVPVTGGPLTTILTVEGLSTNLWVTYDRFEETLLFGGASSYSGSPPGGRIRLDGSGLSAVSGLTPRVGPQGPSVGFSADAIYAVRGSLSFVTELRRSGSCDGGPCVGSFGVAGTDCGLLVKDGRVLSCAVQASVSEGPQLQILATSMTGTEIVNSAPLPSAADLAAASRAVPTARGVDSIYYGVGLGPSEIREVGLEGPSRLLATVPDEILVMAADRSFVYAATPTGIWKVAR